MVYLIVSGEDMLTATPVATADRAEAVAHLLVGLGTAKGTTLTFPGIRTGVAYADQFAARNMVRLEQGYGRLIGTAFNAQQGEIALGSGLSPGRVPGDSTGSVTRGVAFFGESNLRYYTGDNVTLGGVGRPFFFMSAEDATMVGSGATAARYTGMAPSALQAYVSGGKTYGISFPTQELSIRLPTALDAGGWPHFLEGGRTAVRLADPNGGFLINPTSEFITPGGTSMPSGAVLFKLGPDGSWIRIRRF